MTNSLCKFEVWAILIIEIQVLVTFWLHGWQWEGAMLVSMTRYAPAHSAWTLAFPFVPSVFHRACSSWITA